MGVTGKVRKGGRKGRKAGKIGRENREEGRGWVRKGDVCVYH